MRIKIDRIQFEIALAKQCKNATDLRIKDVSSATITRMRKGEAVTTKTLGKVARALQVPVEDLIEH